MGLNKYAPKIVMQLAGEVRRRDWENNHPETAGAKVILHDDRRLVLVRNTYGNPHNFLRPSTTWDIPGGGIDNAQKRLVAAKLGLNIKVEELDEDLFVRSAQRELKEELGIHAETENFRHIETIQTDEQGCIDTIGIFAVRVADVTDLEYVFQKNEIHAAQAFHRENPPEDRRSYIDRVVELL